MEQVIEYVLNQNLMIQMVIIIHIQCKQLQVAIHGMLLFVLDGNCDGSWSTCNTDCQKTYTINPNQKFKCYRTSKRVKWYTL